MQTSQFRHLVMDARLVAAAADGEVAESEMAVIRDVVANTFVGADEIEERTSWPEEAVRSVHGSLNEKKKTCLQQLGNATLTDGQRRSVIDVCCRVVGADGAFDHKEVALLHSLITASGVELGSAAAICPQHAAILNLVVHADRTERSNTKTAKELDLRDLDLTSLNGNGHGEEDA